MYNLHEKGEYQLQKSLLKHAKCAVLVLQATYQALVTVNFQENFNRNLPEFWAQKMQILHAQKTKISHSKMEILCSEKHENAIYFACKDCNGAPKRPPRNLCLENGNFVLKNTENLCPKMEILSPENGNSPHNMNSQPTQLFRDFPAKLGNITMPHSLKLNFCAKFRNPGGPEQVKSMYEVYTSTCPMCKCVGCPPHALL